MKLALVVAFRLLGVRNLSDLEEWMPDRLFWWLIGKLDLTAGYAWLFDDLEDED